MTGSTTSSRLVRAAPDDARALGELARKAYESYIPILNAVPLPMSSDYDALIRDAEVWVNRRNDGLAASLVLVRAEDHLLIESIAVDPDSQGSGLGRLLLDWSLTRASALGFGKVRLYTNVLMTRNREWYRRAGFTETHREQRGDKLVVHMAYEL